MAAAPSTLLTGRADSACTSVYSRSLASKTGQGHFRNLPVGGTVGDLCISSLGVGTYLGPDTDAADQEYEDALSLALTLGVNVLDTAINYRNMRSERVVGRVVSKAITSGALKRSEIIVCTKGGYLSFDMKQPANPRAWLEDTYVKPGIFSWPEFAAGCHCMTAPYIKDQLDKSRKNLGLETIDVYYVHNPETQLGEVTRQEFNSRIRNAFGALEEACREGKISVYGVATWNGFRVPPEVKNHLSLEDLIHAAKDAARGDSHHFKVIQLPFNLKLQEATKNTTQVVNGRRMTVLDAARELGVSVVTSASLMQASLCKSSLQITGITNQKGDRLTNAQLALQFIRSTPGIMTALVGMRRTSHVQENLEIVKFPTS